ncbi:hypothetical protein V501_02461 [Pseudogymnoascus sp. VKM F-4519 (FW-2642)]|nr:hypothetical protein V501_02461 [Pseudogymnoascus sp. VKM F-4519 (FW-2642)]
MSPESSSSSGTNVGRAASPATLEIESARNCVGRVYNFKPYKKWSLDTHHEVDRDWLYQQHPVVVIHRQSDEHVHIVTITSSIDKTIDPRMYMPVSGNHWDTTDNRAKVNLVGTETDASEMPKPRSYVRLDSRKQVPFDVLQEFHSHSGEHYQLSLESTIMLWDSVMEAERGFTSGQELEYQDAEKRAALAVSSYINRWTSVQQGEKQIRMLRVLQEKVRTLVGVVDEWLDQHWLQPQQELERSLSEKERALQDAVREQGFHIKNRADHIPIGITVEAEALRRVEIEFMINQSNKAGKRTPAQNRKLEKLKKVVQNVIREELQRQGWDEGMGSNGKTTEEKRAAKLAKKERKALKARKKAMAPDIPLDWEAAESTLTEAGYAGEDLAFLECVRLSQAG